MKLLKLGTISLDGTKIKANASRHSALSHGHIEQLEIQLKAEVESLLAQAEQADQSAVPDGMNLPAEIARRQARLEAMAAAKAKIEERAQARFEKEQAEYERKLARREAKAKESGKRPGGKPPKPPAAGPKAQDQLNLTDEQSRIMPVAGGGFEQAYNAQAAVDTGSMLVVVTRRDTSLQRQGTGIADARAIGGAARPHWVSRRRWWRTRASRLSPPGMRWPVRRRGLTRSFRQVKAGRAHGAAPTKRFTEPAAPSRLDAAPRPRPWRTELEAGAERALLRPAQSEPVENPCSAHRRTSLCSGFRQFCLRGLKKVTR